ncbi:hypothetical protein TIFTF001_039260, partial [Ficus carica]
MWDSIEADLAKNNSSTYLVPLQKFIFNFLIKSLIGCDPSISPEIAESGFVMLDRWLALQLLPTVKIGVLQPLEEIFLHSFSYPFFLVSGDYNKLYQFILDNGNVVAERRLEQGPAEIWGHRASSLVVWTRDPPRSRDGVVAERHLEQGPAQILRDLGTPNVVAHRLDLRFVVGLLRRKWRPSPIAKGKEVLERGKSEFGLSQEETIHNLLFVLGFNAFGGFSVFLPTLLGTIAGDTSGLQQR